jgi:hypothetical protein
MVAQVFRKVWYLPQENRWRGSDVLSYRDAGKLTVYGDSMEFKGKKETVIIKTIQSVSYGKQVKDFANNWVRVEYGDVAKPSVAFFADGSWLGVGRIFGGTKRILEAVKRLG